DKTVACKNGVGGRAGRLRGERRKPCGHVRDPESFREQAADAGRQLGRRARRHGTGHDFAPQISAAYSPIVRSLENLPDRATLWIAFVAHARRSPYRAATFSCVFTYPVRSARCM